LLGISRIAGSDVLVDEKNGDVVALAEVVEGALDVVGRRLRPHNQKVAGPVLLHLADASQQEAGDGVLITDHGDVVTVLIRSNAPERSHGCEQSLSNGWSVIGINHRKN
jgi:hypothetical protein